MTMYEGGLDHLHCPVPVTFHPSDIFSSSKDGLLLPRSDADNTFKLQFYHMLDTTLPML